jgi:hypothetical protein
MLRPHQHSHKSCFLQCSRSRDLLSVRRDVLHRRLQEQRYVLGGELVALPVGDARGRDGILGPARVDASDTKPLPPCGKFSAEVIGR